MKGKEYQTAWLGEKKRPTEGRNEKQKKEEKRKGGKDRLGAGKWQ